MQQMLNNLRARREDERGFTLIELMVVVLIIAILIAIAIPTFLGAKTRAQDKAAQSSLRNGLTNAKGIYTDTDSYASATPAALNLAEPSLVFQAGASDKPKTVSVDENPTLPVGTVPGAGIVMGAESASGTCFWIADVATGPGSMFAKDDTAATCDATAAPALPATRPAADHATVNNTWAQAW
jgi:type IV pilus assembly protein PilA